MPVRIVGEIDQVRVAIANVEIIARANVEIIARAKTVKCENDEGRSVGKALRAKGEIDNQKGG